MIGLNYLGKMGQLGNQMFQYAAIKGIARKHNYEFCIPDHDQVVDDGLGNKLRIELFDVFDIKNIKRGFVQTNNIVQETSFHFHKELFDACPDNICLVGYFQTEKYFNHIRNEIKKDFKFLPRYEDSYNEIKDLLHDPVALHIRRGDFLINSGNHYNLSMKYYENALKEFDDDRQVVIFSDDTDWCKEQELFSGDRFLVCETNDHYIDLCIMTKCSDFIIANSTYSWWGAWLCNNPNKVVIYPDRWFGPNNEHKSLQDLFPKTWKLVTS